MKKTKFNITPTIGKLIVKRTEENEKTAGGIIIPESAKTKTLIGKVIATGKEITVKPGDNIIFGQYGPSEFKFDGEEYLLMTEADVFGVVE